MRHTTPTCQAHAQPTGKARPNKAGATRQAQGEPTAALADREAFLTEFSPAERLQLSETAKLDHEIPSLAMSFRSSPEVLDYVDTVFDTDVFTPDAPFTVAPHPALCRDSAGGGSGDHDS